MSGLSIERLSEASGLEENRIREYQRENLLPAPEPTPWGSEEYPEETFARLSLIHRAREIGLSWAELRTLVELWFDLEADPDHTRAWLQKRIARWTRRSHSFRRPGLRSRACPRTRPQERPRANPREKSGAQNGR